MDLNGESSVIVVVDPPYALQSPVRPTFALNVGLGLLLGSALGLGGVLILLQIQPTASRSD